jgi:hypothetical protein
MHAGSPEVICDLYEWLPSYGESKVTCSFEGMDLRVTVFYDGASPDSERKVLHFSGVCAFALSAFPGEAPMSFECTDSKAPLGSLVEYKQSEAAERWRAHFGVADRRIRQFQVIFMSDNTRLDVFAEAFCLEA